MTKKSAANIENYILYSLRHHVLIQAPYAGSISHRIKIILWVDVSACF